MRQIILLFIFICPILSNAQEITKSDDIVSSISLGYLSAHRTFENGTEKSLYLTYSFQNRKYQTITDIQNLFIGSPDELQLYLNNLLTFLNENDENTRTEINGCTVSISKMMGKKLLTAWDEDMLGYTYLAERTIKKLQRKFDKWASKNDLVLKSN
jgi:hypothetical protein